MTPEERANAIRKTIDLRHLHLIPPGSIILTPDEAAFCLEELKWRQHWGDCSQKPTGPISVEHPEKLCDCRWGKAKRLLGGAS